MCFLAVHQVFYLRERQESLVVSHQFVQSEVFLRSVRTERLSDLALTYYLLLHIKAVLTTDRRYEDIVHILIEGEPIAYKTVLGLESFFERCLVYRGTEQIEQVLVRLRQLLIEELIEFL